MLRLDDITLSRGGRTLIEAGRWHLRPGDRAALVGRNGAGKTTLLRAILGELEPESGRILRRGDVEFGILRQEGVSSSTLSLWDEASLGMVRQNRLRHELDSAQCAVEAGEQGALDRYERASEAFRQAGGFAMDEAIGEVLHGLGFTSDKWRLPCDTFSGGWRMRIALARVLLSDANLFLLDEPTNHLDLAARGWLTRFLERCPQTVVLVSHDRHLLDQVCNQVLEVRACRLHSFKGNLSAWIRERDQRFESLEHARAQQERQVKKLERFIERFGAKATKASQAQSRQKMLDRMDPLEKEAQEPPPRLVLPRAPHSVFSLLSLQEGQLGWPGHAAVLDHVEIELTRGTRLVLLGPNGGGKSTLIRSLGGQIPLLQGRRLAGEGLRLGIFTQDLAQALPDEENALDYVLLQAPFAGPNQVRAALGALGLGGEAALRPMGSLSGGEKARVALCCFVVQEHNALLLDEPTNHLDAVSVDVLVRALKTWDGALVVATHDRFLAEQVATHIAHVHGGQVHLHAGVEATDFDPPETSPGGTAQPRSAGAVQYEERRRQARSRERQLRQVEDVQRELELADAELVSVDEALCLDTTDYPRLEVLTRRRMEVEARMETLYARWQALEDDIADSS